MDAHAWQIYLEELQKKDPEEYELLVKDIEEMNLQQKLQRETVNVRSNNEGDGDDQVDVRLPNGKILSKDGIKDTEEGIRVDPKPGFVIKTQDQDGMKCFINVCVSPLLGESSTKSQIMQDGSTQEGINIPLSLGPPMKSTDKSGKPCIVYDVVVNPKVVQNAREDTSGHAKSFLCELALQYVEQKYKCSVDYKYKLPKLEYQGDKKNIPYQVIRRSVPKVQVQDAGIQPVVPVIKAKPLAYTLFSVHHGQSPVPCDAVLSDPVVRRDYVVLPEKLQLKMKLEAWEDSVTVGDQIIVNVSMHYIHINASPYYTALGIYLPETVDVHTCTASFDPTTKEFIVEMPVIEMLYDDNNKNPDPGSRPWLLANAIGDDDQKNPGVANTSISSSSSSPVNAVKPKDDFPEDRFHLKDMMSVHIKQEREREREEKNRRHKEEQVKKEQEEKQKKIDATMKKAQEEIEQSKATTFINCGHNEEEEDELM